MGYVTLRLHTRALLSGKGAAALVNYARRHWGKGAWARMDVDAFSGSETLLIARQSAADRLRIAPYALPFLEKYIKG